MIFSVTRTLMRDFFVIKQFLLVSENGNDFKYFRIFSELFDNSGASPAWVMLEKHALPVSMILEKYAIAVSMILEMHALPVLMITRKFA